MGGDTRVDTLVTTRLASSIRKLNLSVLNCTESTSYLSWRKFCVWSQQTKKFLLTTFHLVREQLSVSLFLFLLLSFIVRAISWWQEDRLVLVSAQHSSSPVQSSSTLSQGFLIPSPAFSPTFFILSSPFSPSFLILSCYDLSVLNFNSIFHPTC